jgi:biopolymer transport protein ExbD
VGWRASDSSEDEMSDINMTPLVDVMLVLLIIFMVTVPVMKQAVQVELPRANSQPQSHQPEAVRLIVSAEGAYDLGGVRVQASGLASQLNRLAARDPQPPLLIWGDRMARYEWVAQALAQAQQAGLKKVGFVTDQVKETSP